MKIITMKKIIHISATSGIKGGPLALALLMFFQSTVFAFPRQQMQNWEAPLVQLNQGTTVQTMPSGRTEPAKTAELRNKAVVPGGPDQPEVKGFTPIGISDMVDPFTGDFSYNLPLMDVDGYPINLSYSGGVTMDQEASWVGLGWNLNPGVMNRSMRGIPDDFNGSDKIVKDMNLKRNWTLGLTVGTNFELFGFGPGSSTEYS